MAHPRESCASVQHLLILMGTLLMIGSCCVVAKHTRISAAGGQNAQTQLENKSSWRTAASEIAGVLGIRNKQAQGSATNADSGFVFVPLAAMPRGTNHAAFYAKDMSRSSSSGAAGAEKRKHSDFAEESEFAGIADPGNIVLGENELRKWRSLNRSPLLSRPATSAGGQHLHAQPMHEQATRSVGVATSSPHHRRLFAADETIRQEWRSLEDRPATISEQQNANAADESVWPMSPWLIFLFCLALGNIIGVAIQATWLRAQIRNDAEKLKRADTHDYPTSAVGFV